MTFLCIFGATSPILLFIMVFSPILDDLGDFGDLGDAAISTFSFEEFGLVDESGAGTSFASGVIEATETDGGASSHPSRLS